MKKNVSGQFVGAQMNSKTDGSAVTTGTTTAYVTGDAGTQAAGSVGSGACTHEGQGFWTYAPAQAETNYDHIGFTFANAAAVSATVQIYPSFPQTGDNFARLGAPAGASVSADLAAVKVDTAAVKTKTDFLPSATAGAAGGVFIAGTNAATTITTGLTTTFTGNLTGSVGSVTGAVGSVTGAVGSVTGAVGSVTGAVGSVTGNVGGSVASIASGGIAEASFATTAGSFYPIGIIDQGTAQSATGTTLVLRSAAAFANSELNGSHIVITGGSAGVGQVRQINAYVSGTDTATVDAWTTTPTGTILYKIFAAPSDSVGLGVILTTITSDLDDIQTRIPAALVSGRMDSSTGAMAANVLTASALATDAVNEIVDANWDELLSGHVIAGSSGEALAAAGTAGDPWTTALPGAYGAGTAGKIVGDNINATISSRASQTTLDTLDDFVDTEVTAIKTKTDFLPSVTAGAAGGVFIAGTNAATTITTGLTTTFTGNLTGSVGSVTGAVGSVTGAVGSVTGNVGGNVVGSVASVTAAVTVGTINANVITASSIAADAITAAKIADAAIDANTFAAGAINAAAIAADAITDAKVASDVTIASVTGAVGSVTGAVGSVAAGGITAASFAADAITAAKIAADVTTELQAGLATSAALTTAQTDLDDIQTRLPAALVSGRMDSSVGAMAAGVITATAIAADAITDAKVAADVTIASVTGAVGSVTGNVGGNVIGSVASVATGGIVAGSFAAGAIDAAAIAANAIGASELAADAATEIAAAVRVDLTTELGRIDVATSTRASQTSVDTLDNFVDTEVDAIKVVTDKLAGMIELGVGSPTYYRYNTPALELAPTGGSAPSAGTIADAVWDELLAGHAIGGSAGAALSAAGTAGDPWSTALPGAYGAGTAGKIVGDNINATISSRATQTSVDTIDGIVDNILIDTAEIGAAGAGLTALGDARIANLDATISSRTKPADTQAAVTTVTNLTNAPTAGDFTAVMKTSLNASTPASITGAVGSVTGGVTVTTNNDKTGYRLSATGVDDVWDEPIAGHLAAGSTGLALNDATAAGNPWNSVLEGTLTAGDLLRIQAGVAVGKTTIVAPGNGTAHVEFRDASDLSLIVAADMTGSERTAVALTP